MINTYRKEQLITKGGGSQKSPLWDVDDCSRCERDSKGGIFFKNLTKHHEMSKSWPKEESKSK